MSETPASDPRLALIAAVLAIGETPEGRGLCERFISEAERLTTNSGASASEARQALVSTGVASALEGIAAGLAIAADHAEFLAVKAAAVTTRSHPPRPSNEA